MKKMTNHPLHSLECSLKRALVLSGFSLGDDAQTPEVVPPEYHLHLGKFPYAPPEPIALEQGYFILRTDLIAAQLEAWRRPLPLKTFACGTVYDGADKRRPDRRRIQGIWAEGSIPTRAWLRVWDTVVREAFGAEATFGMTPVTKDSHRIDVTLGEVTFELAHIARATRVAYGILGLDASKTTMWLFDIDVDAVACGVYDIADRVDLYSTQLSFLERFEDAQLSYGSYFLDRARDLLRERGFVNFFGQRFYRADCYRKMHMIQEGWDTNNDGMRLVEPIGENVWLPTVLTPSLEEALSVNAQAGEERCYLFEVAHTVLPYSDSMKDVRERSKNKKYNKERGPREQTDKTPREMVTLAFGAYDDELTEDAWKTLVSDFLDTFGVHEHYYMETRQAIAYELNCSIVVNDKMQMLGGNFGAIHPEARKNYGIDKPAFMANITFAPLEREAAMEMIFVPIEYR